MKNRYDAMVKYTEFNVGDMVKVYPPATEKVRKFQTCCSGPQRVTEKISPLSYVIGGHHRVNVNRVERYNLRKPKGLRFTFDPEPERKTYRHSQDTEIHGTESMGAGLSEGESDDEAQRGANFSTLEVEFVVRGGHPIARTQALESLSRASGDVVEVAENQIGEENASATHDTQTHDTTHTQSVDAGGISMTIDSYILSNFGQERNRT